MEEATRVWVNVSAIEAFRRSPGRDSRPLSPVRSHPSGFKRCCPARSSSGDGTSSIGTESSDDLSIASLPPTSTKKETSSAYEWREGWMKKDSKVMTVRIEYDQSSFPSLEDTVITLPLHKRNKNVLIANEKGNCPHDLTTLEHFNEPTVVECLQRRYEQCDVYTATGPVLLALNPFHHISNVYGDEIMKRYWEKVEKAQAITLPPHVYAIADNSFRSMMRGIESSLGRKVKCKFDQCILVSGESGSGKTVSTKYIMKYLAALSKRASRHATGGGKRAYMQAKENLHTANPKCDSTRPSAPFRKSSDVSNAADLSVSTQSSPAPLSASCIETQVLQSNPILESFGNARTVRNDNSSRFGKFIEMQFTQTGRLVGTKIKTYLLEKVRVVTQSPGERNYHIFYELLSGAFSTEELAALYLDIRAAPKDFKILNNGTFDRRDGVKDADTCRQLRKAMKTMGIGDQELSDVFAISAAILHASNLNFVEAADDGSALDTANNHLRPACDLLGITPEALELALCYVDITAGGVVYRKPLSIKNAEKGLQAFLKAAYGALFSFLVDRVNSTIAFKDTRTETKCLGKSCHVATIGVLDIFGFESFTTNSFEQLCINYCNESLQQQFNTFMLKNEQAEYVNEGIDWKFITFPENQDVLDLLADRSTGLFTVLDDMCRAPKATDKAFALDAFKKCGGMPRFDPGHVQSNCPTFTVHHYAGPIEYSTTGFVEKNRDDLPRETAELLFRSQKSFVHQLADIISGWTRDASLAESDSAKLAGSGTKPTVGGHFRRQVKDLRSKIDATSPHYVRCIKPNELLVPGCFDASMVAHQLRCGGVLQAVSVTRSGFTLHYSHADFLKRYHFLIDQKKKRKTFPRLKKAVTDECERLVKALLLLLDEHNVEKTGACKHGGKDGDKLIRFGRSKVLLKHHAFESLELMVGATKTKCATQINAWIRRYLCRVAFSSVRESFRERLQSMGKSFDEWFRENRELYYQPSHKSTLKISNLVRLRQEAFLQITTARENESNASQKNVSLENPVWILIDGLWARNPSYRNEATRASHKV